MTALVIAAIFSVLVVRSGFKRFRKEGPRALAAPSVIPTAYIAVASLASTAWIYVRGDLGRARLHELNSDTALLIALAVVGFALGAAIHFTPPRGSAPLRADPATLVLIGRLLLCVALAFTAVNVASGAVDSRGVSQIDRGFDDMLVVASSMGAMVSLVIMAVGRQAHKIMYSKWDWVAILALALLTGFTGERGRVLTFALIILILWLTKKSSQLRVKRSHIALVGVLVPLALLTFSTQTLEYRAQSETNAGASPVESLLRDWGSVAFTTGHVANQVERTGTLGGATVREAIVRQLPSPVANELFGPPVDTGTLVFRRMIDYTDVNHGFGFSLAAEGVVNFGYFGAFLFPFIAGGVLAFLYSRLDLARGAATSVIYVIAAATVPIAWRSDLVGVFKSSLYPFVMLAVIFLIAR